MDFTIGAFSGDLLVSDRFRLLVEEFEPERHKFTPISIVNKESRIVDSSRYIFVSGNVLNESIVLDASEINERQISPRVKIYGKTTQSPRIMWKQSEVGHLHLWVDRLLKNILTVSDEFYAEAKSRDMKGWLAVEGRIDNSA